MRLLSFLPFAAALVPAPAFAAPTFSVDFQGAALGAPDGFFGLPITDGDILTTTPPGPAASPNPPLPGPLPFPGIEVGALPGAVGAVPGGLGILPGIGGLLELDALSYGRDIGLQLVFSVDEFASGVPGGLPPDVFTEGVTGSVEASADVFRYLGPILPTPPGPGPGNTAVLDGDGLFPSGLPGVGLLEPNPPTAGFIPDLGDNLDAVDMDTTFADLTGPVFFSLDSSFPDPLEAPPANAGTAIGNGFSGADVLVSFAGAAPIVSIPAVALGLDIFGFDTDDLDALFFNDADGTLTLTPPDTIGFSVRRGSAVIGTPDSTFGIPIEEGDVLTVPTGAGAFPAILISAEALGLGTARSGTLGPFGPDDLDALDIHTSQPPAVPTVPAMGLGGQAALVALLFGTALLESVRRTRRSGSR